MLIHRSSTAAFIRAAAAASIAFFWDLYFAEGAMRVSLLVGVLAVIASFQPSLGASMAATYHALIGTLIGAGSASVVVSIGTFHPAVIGIGLACATPLVVVLTWRNLTEQRLAVGTCALFLLTFVIGDRDNDPIDDPYNFILEGLGSVALGCAIGTCSWALTPIGATADELVKHKLRSASASLSLALRATVALFDVDAEAQSMSKREAASEESPRLLSRVGTSRRHIRKDHSQKPMAAQAPQGPNSRHQQDGSTDQSPSTCPGTSMPKARVAATPLLRNYQVDFLAETLQNINAAESHLSAAEYELPAGVFAVRKICESIGWLLCGACSCCASTAALSVYAQENKWIYIMQKIRVITKLQQFAAKLVSGSPLHVLSVQGLSESLSTVASNQATLLIRAVAYETRHDGWLAAMIHHPHSWPNRIHHDSKQADRDAELEEVLRSRDALVHSLSVLLRRYAIVRKASCYSGTSEIYENTTALLGMNTIMFGAIRCSQLILRATFSPRHVVGEVAPTQREINGHSPEDSTASSLREHITVDVDSSESTPRPARTRGVFASDGPDLSCCSRWSDTCSLATSSAKEYFNQRLFQKVAWQRAAKLTVAIIMVSLLSLLDSGFEHTAWGPLAVAFAANSNDGNTFASGLFRLEGTVLGALFGYFSIRFAFGVDFVAVILLALTVGVINGLTWTSKTEVRSVAMITAFTSAVIALGAEVTDNVDAGSNLALSRIEQNVLGVVGLLLVVVFIFPNRKSDTLPAATATMLRQLAKATADTSTLLQRTLHTDTRDSHGRKQSGIKHDVEVPAAVGKGLSKGTESLPTKTKIAHPGALGPLLGSDERSQKQIKLRDAALALYHVGTPGELDTADRFLLQLPNDIGDAEKDLRLFRQKEFPTGPWRRLQRVLPKLVVHLRLINQCRIALALQRADVHSRMYARLSSQRSMAPDSSLDESAPKRELQYCARQMVKKGSAIARRVSTAGVGDHLHEEMDLTAEDVLNQRRSITPESDNSTGSQAPDERGAAAADGHERGNSNEDNPFVFAGLLHNVTNFLQCAEGTILQAAVVMDAVGAVVQGKTWFGIWVGTHVADDDSVDRDAVVAAIEKLTEDETRMVAVCTEFLNAYDSAVHGAVQTVSKWLQADLAAESISLPENSQNGVPGAEQKPQASDKIPHLGRNVDCDSRASGSPSANPSVSSTQEPHGVSAAQPPQPPRLSKEVLQAASRNIAAKSLISNAEAIYFSAIGFALQEMTQRISDLADGVSDIFVRCSSQEYDAAVLRKLESSTDFLSSPRARANVSRPDLQREHGCLYGSSAADEPWFKRSDATLRALHATTTHSDILQDRSARSFSW